MSGKMDTEYPELWKYIKPRLSKLICFIDLAIKNCYDKELSNDNKPVFYSSLAHLETVFGTKSRKTVNNTINLFALLDLIKKLPKENIPDNMLKKAKRIAATKGHKKLVNHYQIPSYCTNTLEKSENKAKVLKENNFTMKGLSREWVIRTFGQDIANIIYPQYKHENKKGTSKKSDNRTNDIVKVMMNKINNKGYVTEKEIVEELRGKYGKAFIQTQLKRSLQEILEGYDLKRIRCNKQIKEQFGVTGNGYPFIIVKN
ncbi:MAG TPA: hypothetical protein VK982_11940 [Bacteroidales bacterium]|nr:hypothetical protein [Bacteroidales bacterium]